jgi:ubiquinone/menaquinone biosynthesis C-methylase UbiE
MLMTERESARTRAFYETVADGYARALDDVSVEPPIDLAVIADFAASLPSAEPTRVLDAGCGTGRLTGHLPTLNPAIEAVGVDLSPAMLAHARERNPGIPFVEADLSALPFGDGHFHGIFAWYSIIHTPPHALPALFREFARVLRPGGMLLLGYQSGVGERVRSGAYGSDVELHAYLHHTPYVQAASAEAGLTVDTVLTRSPRRTERLPQGFVLARRS